MFFGTQREGGTMKALILVLAAGIVTACGGMSPERGIKSDINVITEQEIRETAASNAYELITLRRPQFLRPQGARGPASILNNSQSSKLPEVYVDGHRYGYPADLKNLGSVFVKEIRYVNGQDANFQYGFGHDAGIIRVTTNR